jgi:hypothetical protein
MDSNTQRQLPNCLKQLTQWLKQLMQCKWLMEIVKFLVPFLISFFYPHLAVLIEVLILVWDLWNCFRQG